MSKWNTRKIKKIANYTGTGIDKKIDSKEKEVFMVNYMDVYKHKIINSSLKFKKGTAKLNEFKYDLKEGDILFTPTSEIPEDIGWASIIEENLDNTLYSYHLIRFRLKKSEEFNKYFLRYILEDFQVRKQLMAKASGVTRYTLGRKDFENIELTFPNKPIQEKIALIISTVDDNIEQTKIAIEKSEKLKKSLMQNLLTGKIKFDGTVRSEEDFYEDEKYGLIPKNWENKQLKNISEIKRGKFSPRPRNDPQFYGGEYPFIQTNEIVKSDLYLKNNTQTLNEKGLKVSKLFKKGTIIITIAANIGDIAISSYDVCFPDSLIGITPNEDMDAEYLAYCLMRKKQILTSQASESAQKNINYSNLRPLLILKPKKDEQEKIAQKITAVFNNINSKKNKIKKLERLKKSLMQNLLTGKIQVKVN